MPVKLSASNGAARVRIVVDCWRLLSGKFSNRTDIRYVALGRSLDDAGNDARLDSLFFDTLER